MEIKDSKITRVWAEVIDNKKIETMLPIICSRIVVGSLIHTDEHRTYKTLKKLVIFIRVFAISMNLLIRLLMFILNMLSHSITI